MAKFQLSQDAAAAMARASVHDRVVGTLFGSALGDAIGLYTEFLSGSTSKASYPSASFTLCPKPTPFRHDHHRAPNVPGEWTDDTDQAMLILLSFLHSNGAVLDPSDVAARMQIWVRMGLRPLDTLPLGLGSTTASIVRSETYLDYPEATSRKFWTDGGFKAAPNGSLMRTHPLGLMCLNKTVDETFQVAANFSVITHVDPRCIISCAIGTALVRGLVLNEIRAEYDIDRTIEEAWHWWKDYRRLQMRDPRRRNEPDLDLEQLRHYVNVTRLNDLQLDDQHTIGYVYKCLGSGIHLLRLAMRQLASRNDALHTQIAIFERLITDLVMLGGDADTNACFAGALLGALLGYRALPSHWRDGLVRRDWLMHKAEGLSQLIGASDGVYSGAEDKDTRHDGGRGFLTAAQVREKEVQLDKRIAQRHQEWKKKEKEKR